MGKRNEEDELMERIEKEILKNYVKFAKISFDLHPNLWYNKKGRDKK